MEAIGLAAILEDKAFQDGLRRYEQGISQMGTLTDQGAAAMSKVWAVGSGVVIAGAAGVAAGMAGILAVTKQGLDAITQWGNDLDDLGDKLGTTGEQSSTWALAMKQVGLDVAEGGGALNIFIRNLDDLKNTGGGAAMTTAKNAEAIQSLQERLDDANVRLDRAKQKMAAAEKPTQEMQWAVDDAQKAVSRLNAELGAATKMVPAAAEKMTPFQAALKTLGVRAFDAHGKLRTFDDLMPEIMRGFSQIPDGVKKSALAMDLFGKSGTKFLDFLDQGPEGIKKATELAKLYGLTLSTDMVQATQDFQNAMEISKMGLQGFWVQIGAKVLPVANKFVNFFNYKLLPPLIKFAQWIAPKLGEGLERVELIFEDFFALVSGENKLPQLAKNIGDLAGMFGLSETAVTDFVLKALTALGQFKDWVVGFLPLIQKGDWGGIWERLVQGAAKGWDMLQPILTEWGGKIWSWLEDAANAAPGAIGAFLDRARAFLAENGPKAWTQLTTWGAEFWSWLTASAIPDLSTKIGTWLSTNGPKAWEGLSQWGTEFWDWLTDPTKGAIVNAGVELTKVATALGTWASTAWDSTIQPALAEWGTKFWDWLVGENGAVAQLSTKITEVSDAILQWSESPETQQAMYDAGYNLADWLIDGIGSLFDGQEGDERAGKALEKLGMALLRAQLSLDRAKYDIGGKIGQGIYDRLAEWFTENAPKLSARIYEWLNKAADDLLANLSTLAEKLGTGIAGALAEFWKTHPLTLPALQLPQFTPTSFIPASGGGNAQQIAALRGGGNMALQVLIDGQEIKNAVLKVSFDEVTNLFNSATQAVMTN